MADPTQKDWGKAPLSQVIPHGLSTLLPSAAVGKNGLEVHPGSELQSIWDGAKAIPGVAKVLLDPNAHMPTAAEGKAWLAAHPGPGAPGSLSRLAGAAKQDIGNAANGIGNSLHDEYGTWENIKRTLATHPESPVNDAATALSLLGGGEGLMARVPGVGGALSKAARVAGMAGEAINPPNWVLKPTAAAASAVAKATKGAALTKTGEFTPQALAAVNKAFPKGEIGPNELADPAFKATLAKTFGQKGVSPASVKEAVLTHNGAPSSLSLTTQRKPPTPAAPMAMENKAAVQTALDNKGSALAGDGDPNALASALKTAHEASGANRDAAYAQAGAQKDLRLSPEFNDILNKHIDDAFDAENLPSRDRMATLETFPHTLGALGATEKDVSDLASSDQLTLQNLEHVRQSYNTRLKAAAGSDQHGLVTMKGALDNGISDALSAGAVTSGDPAQAAQGFSAARQANVDHMNTYEGNGANPTIKKAVGLLQGSDDNPGNVSQAQSLLTKGFFSNPDTLKVNPGGERLYHDLNGALGDDGQSALDDHIKSVVMGSRAKPDAVRDFVDSPLGQTMAPEDQAQARLLAAGQDVASAKPVGPAQVSGWDKVAPRVRSTAGALAGAGAGYLVGHGMHADILGEALGIPFGVGASHALDGQVAARQIASEVAGAPNMAPGATALAKSAVSASSAVKPLPFALEAARPQQQQDDQKTAAVADDPYSQGATILTPSTPPAADHPDAPPPAKKLDPYADGADIIGTVPTDAAPPQGYASGGGVTEDVTPLVDQLDKLIKHARRAEKARTEPLLSVPDSTVIKALSAAQKAMA